MIKERSSFEHDAIMLRRDVTRSKLTSLLKIERKKFPVTIEGLVRELLSKSKKTIAEIGRVVGEISTQTSVSEDRTFYAPNDIDDSVREAIADVIAESRLLLNTSGNNLGQMTST